MINYVCIVGAPRSGTTILGDALSTHPDIAYIYEPYFIWDNFFGPMKDDSRTSDMVTPEISNWIRNEFEVLAGTLGTNLVLDKSPLNSFRIPFVRAVFPNAKFIHIVRDGRNVTVSSYKRWKDRTDFNDDKNYRKFMTEAWERLIRRPTMRTRIKAVAYELRHNLKFSAKSYYAAYYNGKTGWGVRYPGYERDMDQENLLDFNAMQWKNSIVHVKDSFNLVPIEDQLTIRYEDFTQQPASIINSILEFIDLPPADNPIVQNVRHSTHDSYKALSDHEVDSIQEIIGTELEEFGYC